MRWFIRALRTGHWVQGLRSGSLLPKMILLLAEDCREQALHSTLFPFSSAGFLGFGTRVLDEALFGLRFQRRSLQILRVSTSE